METQRHIEHDTEIKYLKDDVYLALIILKKQNLDIDIIKLMKSRGRLVGNDWLHTL